MLVSSVLNAQVKRETLKEVKIGQFNCSHKKTIDLDTEEVFEYVSITFQDANYSHIISIKSVLIPDAEVLAQFIKDLENAYPEMTAGTDMNWTRNDYGIDVYDFNKWLYLRAAKGKAYAMANRKQIENLIIWLKTIDL